MLKINKFGRQSVKQRLSFEKPLESSNIMLVTHAKFHMTSHGFINLCDNFDVNISDTCSKIIERGKNKFCYIFV